MEQNRDHDFWFRLLADVIQGVHNAANYKAALWFLGQILGERIGLRSLRCVVSEHVTEYIRPNTVQSDSESLTEYRDVNFEYQSAEGKRVCILELPVTVSPPASFLESVAIQLVSHMKIEAMSQQNRACLGFH